MASTGSKRKHSCKILSSEENEFTWEIPNFRNLIATNAEINNVAYYFEAGSNIELPTSWRVYLQKRQNNLGIYMQLLQAPEGIQNVKATFGFKTLKNERKYTSLEHKANNGGWGWHNGLFLLNNFTDDNLVNGNLVIHINFTIHNDVLVNEEYKRRKFVEESRDATVGDIQAFLDSGEDADVTFRMADGRTLKAHAGILKARNRVFSAMLHNPMEENATGVIRIEDVTYPVMKRILTFIYSGNVEDDWEEVVEELVYACNKYELLHLFKFCDDNLASTCTPENAWSRMDFANLHGLQRAEGEIAEYIQTHIAEILQAKRSS